MFTVLLLICLVDAAAPEIQDKLLLRETIKGNLTLNKHMIPQVLLFGFGVKSWRGNRSHASFQFRLTFVPHSVSVLKDLSVPFSSYMFITSRQLAQRLSWSGVVCELRRSTLPPTVSRARAAFGLHL